jgi:hypothetical protein
MDCVRLVKQLKCLCKTVTKFTAKFHIHTCVLQALSWSLCHLCDEKLLHMLSSADVALMTNARSKTGQMAVCCQNLMLGVLSSRSALSMLVVVLFKKLGLFFNMPCKCSYSCIK